MKKLKNFLLGLFALMLVIVPVALVGCGEAKPEVEIADGEYYCAYVEGTDTYQAIQLDKEEEVVSLYVCPAAYLDDVHGLMALIESGDLSVYATFDDYTTSIVDGKETITISAQLEYYSVVYTAVATDEGKKVELNEKQTNADGEVVEYDHEFFLYTQPATNN